MQTKPLRVIWFLPLPLAVIAEARGYCADRGVSVETVVTASSDQQFDAFAAGEVDAAVTAMDNVFMWNRRGPIDDLRVVAQMEFSTGSCLMARPGINTIAELKDAELLVDSPDNGFVVLLRAMLHDAGLAADDYRMKIVGGVRERFEGLLSGNGDAALLVPIFEPALISKGGSVLARVEDLYPDFPGQGLVTRQSASPEVQQALCAWLAALNDAREWSSNNREGAFAILREQGMDPAVAEALMATVPADFVPQVKGIDLLIDQRRRLGLPGAEGGQQSILDTQMLWGAAP